MIFDNQIELLDPRQLQAFVIVSETASFTRAAQRLGISQSTVSQRVRLLERTVERELLERDTQTVTMTPDGEAMRRFAVALLELNQDAVMRFSDSVPRRRIRFGASDDFTQSRLPDVLRRFRKVHPHIDIELTIALSSVLERQLNAREIDLILIKREPGDGHGTLVGVDDLRWFAAEGFELDEGQPLPLILLPEPSLTRELTLRAMKDQNRSYRAACTANGFSGLFAAALAGLGLLPHALPLTPLGLVDVTERFDLPELGSVEFALVNRRKEPTPIEQALSSAIRSSLQSVRVVHGRQR